MRPVQSSKVCQNALMNRTSHGRQCNDLRYGWKLYVRDPGGLLIIRKARSAATHRSWKCNTQGDRWHPSNMDVDAVWGLVTLVTGGIEERGHRNNSAAGTAGTQKGYMGDSVSITGGWYCADKGIHTDSAGHRDSK